MTTQFTGTQRPATQCPHVCANSDLCTVTVSLRVCNTCPRSSQAVGRCCIWPTYATPAYVGVAYVAAATNRAVSRRG